MHKTNGDLIELTNPTNLPDPSEIDYMEEPDEEVIKGFEAKGIPVEEQSII